MAHDFNRERISDALPGATATPTPPPKPGATATVTPIPTFGPKRPQQATPTPTPSPAGVPWFLDLDFYDFVKDTLKVPVGSFQIQLDDRSNPLGGVVPSKFGELTPTSSWPIAFRDNPNEFVWNAIKKSLLDSGESRDPTDDEIVQVLVVAGHKPLGEPVFSKTPVVIGSSGSLRGVFSYEPADFLDPHRKTKAPFIEAVEHLRDVAFPGGVEGVEGDPFSTGARAAFAGAEVARQFARGVGATPLLGIVDPALEAAGVSEDVRGKVTGQVAQEVLGELGISLLPVVGWPKAPMNIFKGLRFAVKDIPQIQKVGIKAYAGTKLTEMGTELAAQRAKFLGEMEEVAIERLAARTGLKLDEKTRDRLRFIAQDPDALRNTADNIRKGAMTADPEQATKRFAVAQEYDDIADMMAMTQGIARDAPLPHQIATQEWVDARKGKDAPKIVTNRLKQAARDTGVPLVDEAGTLRASTAIYDDVVASLSSLPSDPGLQFWPRVALFSAREWGGMVSRAAKLRSQIQLFEEIIKGSQARRTALKFGDTAAVDNLKIVDDFVDSLEEISPGVRAEPSAERAAAAGRATGMTDEEVAALNLDQLVEEILARRKQMLAINRVEIAAGGPSIPMAAVSDAMQKAAIPEDMRFDIWRMLRFQLAGEDTVARLTGTARVPVAEAVETTARVDRSAIRPIVEVVISDTSQLERALPIITRALEEFGGEVAGKPVGLSAAITKGLLREFEGTGITVEPKAIRSLSEALAKWYNKNVKKIAKADIRESAPERLLFTTRRGTSQTVVPNQAFVRNTRVLFGDSPRLADELKAMVDIPADLGVAQGISPTERMKQLIEVARKAKIPELQAQITKRTKGLPKPTKKAAKESRAQLKPARKELAELEANIQATRDINIEFQEELAKVMKLEDDPRVAADPDKARQLVAGAEAARMEEAVNILQRRLAAVGRGKDKLALADEEMIDALKRLTEPEVLVSATEDVRVLEVLNAAPQRARKSLLRLFSIMQPDELRTAGEQVAGRSRLPVVGPLIKHITGRFSNNPMVLGVFWQQQVGKAMGGMLNSSNMGTLTRLAKQLTPRAKGLGRLMEGDRLEAHLANSFVDSKEARQALGFKGTGSKFEDEAVDLYKRQLIAFLRKPELYPNIGEEFEALPRIYAALDDDVNAAATVMGVQANAEVEAARESILGKGLQALPSDDTLRRGIGPTWEAIAEEISRTPAMQGKTLKDVVKQGQGLLIDFQEAKFRHLLNRHTVEAIADLAVGPRAVDQVYAATNDLDKLRAVREAQKRARAGISYVNKQWAIKGLENWPTEMRSELQGLMGALSGTQAATGILGTAQDLFRNVMMWRLVMDASIFGIQGSFYASMRGFMRPGVVGEPVQMFDAIRMIDDEHFIQWVWGNQDELMTYFANGLEVGLETLVSTATTQRPLLIEYIPALLGRLPGAVGKGLSTATAPLGGLGKFARVSNDIMFDRWMLFMKTNLIRQHLDSLQYIRRFKSGFRPHMDDIMGSGEQRTGLGRVADDLGGTDQLYLSSPEDTLRAVIRVVNQQLGGLPRSQTARGLWRETAENFALFVPGFWRARLGLLNAALTKPFSTEGHLALSVVMREYAFLGSVGAFLSWSSGNLNKFNYWDARKADWLSAQFGDFSVPMVPSSAGSSRIVARLVGGMNDIKDPKERIRALDILASGRLHPLFQALKETIEGRDFLGNSLQGKQERFLQWSRQFMPIFVEQAGEMALEGDEDLVGIATKSLAEFIGKNVIPRNPLEHLDDAAAGVSGPNGEMGRRWFELGTVEQANVLGAHPELQQHLDDFEERQHDRASSKEQRQEGRFDEFTVIAKNTDQALIQLGEQLDSGVIDDGDFRDGRREAFDFQFGQFEAIERAMVKDGFDPEESFEKRREKKETVGLVDQAVIDYRNVRFDDFQVTETVPTLEGPIEITVPDFDGFDAARALALSPYPAAVRTDALAFIRQEEPPIEKRFRDATDALDKFLKIPKYVGLSSDEGALLDTILGAFSQASQRIGSEAEQKGTEPTSGAQTRTLIANGLLSRGFIKTTRERQILALALVVARKPALKEDIVNASKGRFVIDHPDLSLFYGFTAGDVPDEQRGLLPFIVQQRFESTFQEGLKRNLDFAQ